MAVATGNAAPIRYRPPPGEEGTLCHLTRSMVEESGMWMARLDPGLRVTDANAEFCQVFLRMSGDIRGRSFVSLVHPDSRDELSRKFATLVDGGQFRFTHRVAVGSGARPTHDVELAGIAVPDDAGRIVSVIVLVASGKVKRGGGPRIQARLSPVGAAVLEGVAVGMSTVQVAAQLYLSRGGVEYHINTLLRKLKVANRSALVSKAYSMGLFSVGNWPPKVSREYVK